MPCWNRKTLLILAGVALATLVVAPSAFAGVAPLLIALACPIGMLLMMGVAGARGRQSGSHCSKDGAPDAHDEGEIARLRAEVAALRAESDTGTKVPGR